MSLTLLDWRRTVAAMYAAVREGAERDPEATLATFRTGRERLIQEHPQSPIRPENRGAFTGLDGRPGPHSGNAAASNGLLHDEMLGYLNQRY